jgi:4-aminobutyrate aminotransferase-like enzyme
MSATDLLARRAKLLGARAPLFYKDPVHIIRGEGVWLFSDDGTRYLDVYNNVPCVGHCHPYVLEALNRQASTLNVHTRYLHELILDYTERLTGLHEDPLAMATITCTGSEANEIALRIARQCTGGMGVICTNAGYHGNSAATDEISTLIYGGTSPSLNVRSVPFPETYRPFNGLSGEALSDALAGEVKKAIDDFADKGIKLAGMLICPIYANEGLPDIPPGYMGKAVQYVRDAGGLFIADEVQAGFGRTGKMWGYQIEGIVPDIVTMGKPMGNGFPLAGIVTSPALLNQFQAHTFYFNTYGGNPVQCAVGMAVLDVIEQENLVENAAKTGDYIREGLKKLQSRHERIGDVRGHGLFLGAEWVKDPETREPDAAGAYEIVNKMKDKSILISNAGAFHNVLKMRPPLPFAIEHADLLLTNLEEVLSTM